MCKTKALISCEVTAQLSWIAYRRPHFSNIFSNETDGTIKAKLHVVHPMEGETKVCRDGPDHMTKMATSVFGVGISY